MIEVRYPKWLANPVVVKKINGKWIICVDFTEKRAAIIHGCVMRL